MTNEEAIEVIEQDIPCEHDTDLIEALNMAITALKAEPCEDAVDAIMRILTELGYGDEENGADAEYMSALWDVAEKVKELTREAIAALKAEPCEDAISRQIISDYVQSHIQEINTGYGDLNKHTNEILRMIVDYIESMPPVTPQPEIVRCKDCKHRDAEIGFCKGRGWPMQLVPDDGFCDKGERSEE